MLQVDHLEKRYGPRVAVSDVSFRVGHGEIVGFLGPNGAGKSTTLRVVTGFLSPTAGAVRVDGIDALKDARKAVSRVGYMPEGVPLYPEMRVREYLHYRARLKGVARARIRAQADAALTQAGVADAADRIIGHLSKGYRQRVGLADALVADPPFLILDEPTSGLDPNQVRHVRDLIRGFAGKKTVLVSTHILPEVEATCSRVVIIAGGKVVGEGAPGELRAGAGGERVVFVVRGDRGAAERALSGLAALRAMEGVTREGDVHELRATFSPSGSPQEAAVAALVGAGLSVREVRPLVASLEDVFASLTTTDAASDRRASSSGAIDAPAAAADAPTERGTP